MQKDLFKKYLEEAFGVKAAEKVLAALECPPSVSVRLNPSKWKAGNGTVTEIAGAGVNGKVPWSEWGCFLKERPVFTLDPLIHAGAYYVQDSSSMFVGFVFRQVLGQMLGKEPVEGRRSLRVLDLCAAPGGKTTDLAASLREMLGDRFILVSNEVMKNRAGTLADNVALWGDPNVVVTSADPAAFARLEGFFDIIVTDVPCSGEGMFRKDEGAVEQWSEDNVELCVARQRRILADVWPALRDGGLLIYSTCTFNRRENDGNVHWIASQLGAEIRQIDSPFEGPVQTECGYSLAPGFVSGEGQYCAALLKKGGAHESSEYCAMTVSEPPRAKSLKGGEFRRNVPDSRKSGGKNKDSAGRAGSAVPEKELSGLFSIPVVLRSRGETIIAVPQNIAPDLDALETCLRPLLAGVAAGTMKAGKLIPSADLALSTILSMGEFQDAELDRKVALEFLHRDTIRLDDSPLGYVTVSYKGHRLGFVKNIGNRCNNLHPMSRRILMNLRGK